MKVWMRKTRRLEAESAVIQLCQYREEGIFEVSDKLSTQFDDIGMAPDG